jgi:hypothetical protein
MRYLLLIYTEEWTEPPSPEAMAEQTEAYNAFGREITERGAFRAGEALHPTSSATTVRVRDGETLTTDGPYAETKEALGGFYVIEASDLDEAIEIAARIPGARHGAIEVRPIFDFAGAAAEGGAADAAGVA